MDEPGPAASEETLDDERRLLRLYLSNRDVPCPQCGYNLRTLTSDICPECGEQVVLRVAMVEPKQAALLTGLIGLSAGAGLNGLLLVYAALMAVHDQNFVTVNAVEFCVMAIWVWVWLRCWRWIRARSFRTRWRLAVFCWFGTVADLVAFSWFV